jgi:hypothetical protein
MRKVFRGKALTVQVARPPFGISTIPGDDLFAVGTRFALVGTWQFSVK